MRRITLGMVGFTAATLAGCGGGAHFANLPRPPAPINLTVGVNDQRVSVSPTSIGAGPVLFIITNQASNAESLAVARAGGSLAQPLADTGPISPQGTAQLTVNLRIPGAYTVAIAPTGSTEASAVTPTGIQPALVRVGRPRPSANNALQHP
jgi:hypothetical protein